MSEFNGKKFYGYSMENDPDLVGPTWNTKNFEFSCIRPETVQRAIEKVNSDVGASLKQKKSSLLGRLREKCGDGENEVCSNRDADVETHISKAQQFSINEFEQIHAKTKQMSDGEKDSSGKSSHSHSGDNTMALNKQCERSKGGENAVNLQRAVLERYQEPQPKWVEISEPKLATLQMFDLKHPPLPPAPQPFGYSPNMFQMPYPYPPNMMQSVGYVYNQQQIMENYGFQNPYGDYDPNAYLVEDSDLEDEMLRREHYTKFIQKRPDVKETRGTDETESCAEFVNIAPQEPYTDMSYLKNTIPMRYSEMSDEEVKEEPKSQHPKVIIKKRKQAQETINSSSKAVTKNAIKKDSKKEKTSKSKTLTFAKLLAEERILSSQADKAAKTSTKRQSKYSTSPHALHTNRKSSNQHRNLSEQQSNAQMQKIALVTINGKSIEQLKAEKLAIFNKMSRTHERLIDALQQLRNKLLEVYVPESTSDRNRRNRNGFEFSVRFLRNFLYPLKGMIDTMRNTPREHFNSVKSNDACNRVSHIYSLFLQAVFTYSKQLRHFMIDQVPQKLTTLLEMLFSTTNMCLDKRLFDRHDTIVECLLSQCSSFLSFLEDLHAQRFVAARECYRKSSGEQTQSKYDLKMFMNDLNMYEPKLVPKLLPKRSASSRQHFGSTGHRKSSTNNTNNNSNTNNAQELQQAPPMRRLRKRIKHSKNPSKLNLERAERTSTSDVNEPKRIECDVPTQVQNWQHTSDTEQKDSQEILQNIQNILQKTPNLDKYKKVDLINRSILKALHNNRHHHTREILHPLLKTIDSVRSIPKGDNGIENILKAFQIKISTLLNEENFQGGSGKEAEQIEFPSPRFENTAHEELVEQTDSNEEQSDIESEQMQSNNQNNHNSLNHHMSHDEEVDLDGQFYISGEDCSDKRTTCSRKSKLEPLIEIVDESEAVELYSSDTELYTPLRVNIHNKPQRSQDTQYADLVLKPKHSPYDIPLSRRSHKAQKKSKSPVGHSIMKKAPSHNQTSVTGSSKISSAKSKSTTVPPSPAMMRLQQRGQSPLTEYSKKNNLLKKHTRRNPMASPPPPPTVSPSTSIACTPSPNTCDFHLSLSNTSTSSHKGCSVNITNHETVGSSKLSHQTMTHSENDTNLGTFYNVNNSSSSKNVSRHLSTQNIEKKKSLEAFLSVVENTESGDENMAKVQTVQQQRVRVETPENKIDGSSDNKKNENFELNNNENGCGDHNNTPCQLHHESNSKVLEKSSVEKLDTCLNGISQKKCTEESPKVNFDEMPLLKERDQYLSHCIRNRLYTNPNFATPWKILSRLSQQLTREIVKDVESDFNTGVLSFVDDFLEQETRI